MSTPSVIELREVSTKYLPHKIGSKLNEPGKVFKAFDWLKIETKEHFLSVHLNTKNQIISYEVVSIGSLNASLVHPRELYKAAILANSASIILVHNHPSGDITPSSEDITLTKRLVDCGKLLGLEILDHIIIGNRYLSFKEEGLI